MGTLRKGDGGGGGGGGGGDDDDDDDDDNSTNNNNNKYRTKIFSYPGCLIHTEMKKMLLFRYQNFHR